MQLFTLESSLNLDFEIPQAGIRGGKYITEENTSKTGLEGETD